MREPQGTWEKGDYKRGRAFLGGGDRVGGRGGRRRAQSPALDILGWGAWQASPEAGWCLK